MAFKKIKPSVRKEIQRELYFDIAQFIWYYGNDTFKDGDIPYFHFVHLTTQIPALEAKNILMHTEATIYGNGEPSANSKKRLKTLQTLARNGVTD